MSEPEGTEAPPSLFPYLVIIGLVAAAIGGIAALLGDLRDDYGFSDAAVGVIVASGFAAALVAQLTLAPLADRGHARSMVTAGLALSALAMFGMAFSDQLWQFIVTRSALGFGGGLILPGVRRAAIVADPEHVGKNLGKLVAGEVTGFVLGPALAAALAEIGGLKLSFGAFGAAMVIFLPFAMRLPQDRGAMDDRKRRAFDLLADRRIVGSLLLVAGYFALIGAFEAVIPIQLRDRGASTLEIGLAFTLLALPIVIAGPIGGRLADRVGAVRVAAAGMGISASLMILLGIVPGVVALIGVLMVIGIADGFGFTAGQLLVSESAPEERQAGAMGLLGATEVGAAGLAAVPAAAIYSAIGASVWIVLAIAMLAVMAGGVLLVVSEDRARAAKEADA